MSFDVGDIATLDYSVTVDGNPGTPATCTLTVTDPNGVVTTYTPAPDTFGAYHQDVPLDVAGLWSYRWVSTGNGAAADSGVFDVGSSVSGGIISLEDAKAQLRVKTSSNDEELRLFVAAATALIEHEVGAVIPASHTEVVEAAETIVLAKAPVISLTSLATLFPTVDYTFNAAQYTLDGPAGLLRRIPFIGGPLDWSTNYNFTPDGGWPGGIWDAYRPRLTVTYVAGRPIVPAPLQLAARIIVAHMWETRRGAGPKPAGGDDDQLVRGEMIPDEAVLLMAPYRRAPMIA